MKQFYYLILFAGGWIFSIQASAQDLIERTQLGVVLDVSRQQASVAHQESQSLKHTGPYQEIKPFTIAPSSRRAAVNEFIEGQVMLDLPEGALPRLMESLNEGVALGIPVSPGKEIILDLVEVFPINSEFVGHLSDGTTYTLSDYPARFYRGAIKGVPNSFATITIAENMFRGLIGDDFGNYVLAELNNKDNEFILYNDRKLKIDQNFECGVEDLPFSDEDQEILRQTERIVNTNRSSDCVDIMVEMEEDFYDDWNNVTSANNFIYALINEVATLYNNEDISITLKDIIMWTTTDPYTSTGACAQRTAFADFRQNNYNGRLAHLITSRGLGGGCAFIDELCSNYSSTGDRGPYSCSGNMTNSVTSFPTYSWNVYVFAHEMGHTVGSRHTHACVWNGNNTAIDGCSGSVEGSCSLPSIPSGGGTIMSYCHLVSVGVNFNLGFGLQPGNLIRSKVYNGTCAGLDCGNISQCPRYIYLDGNVISDTYYADIKIEMGGRVLNGRNVQLRSEGLIELNPGFRVDVGGYWLGGYSTCAAALEGGNNSNEKTNIEKQVNPMDLLNSTNK